VGMPGMLDESGCGDRFFGELDHAAGRGASLVS
jgi:hypothetical protein